MASEIIDVTPTKIDEHKKLQLFLNRSSVGLYVVALFFMVHLITAISLAAPEKRTAGVVVGGGTLNLAVMIFLIFLGRRVRVGKSLTWALCLGWFLLLGAFAAGTATLAMGYQGKPFLAIVQIAFIAVQCWSVTMTTRTALLISNNSTSKKRILRTSVSNSA